MFSFSPQDRARAIADRIEKLSTQPPSQVLPIHVVDYETTTEIAARDLVVMAVTDGDARPLGLTRQALAAQYAQLTEATIVQLRNDYSARTIFFGIVYSILVTLALLGILKLLRTAYPCLIAYVEFHRDSGIPSF